MTDSDARAELEAMLPRGLAEHLPADDRVPEVVWLTALRPSREDWESARVVRLLRTIANRKGLGGLGKAWLTLTLEKKPLDDLTEAAREALEAELAEQVRRLANALENSEGRHAAVNADTPAHIDGVLLFDHRLAEFVEKLGENGEAYAEQVRGDSRKLTEGKTKTLDLMRANAEAWLEAMEKLRLNDGEVWTQSATFLGTSSGILTGLGRGMGAVSRDFELAPLLEAWLPTLSKKTGHVILPMRVRELAAVVWEDVVGPRLEELAEAKRRPAALQIVVHESAMHFHSRSSTYDPASRNLTFDGRTLATAMGASFDLAILERGLGELGSVASHRLFQWQVRTGHERYLRGETYPNVLEVDGGWSELARRLGLNPEKTTPNLRAMVYAQAHFRFQFPDGSEGNLLSYTEKAAKGRNEKARVVITLGSPLLPSYVHGLSRAEGRKLVPMLRETPPLYGRPNEHGAQLTMSLAVMARLRAGAREIAEHGGARIDDDAFTQMADVSGLKRKLIVPVRDLWLKGDTRAPPFLQRNNDGRINLHDHHDVERDFIEAAGKKERSGVIGGKAAVKRKEGKLGRYSRK